MENECIEVYVLRYSLCPSRVTLCIFQDVSSVMKSHVQCAATQVAMNASIAADTAIYWEKVKSLVVGNHGCLKSEQHEGM
jgi:hypothetical protein